MGLFDKKKKGGVKCPVCGSYKTSGAKGVKPVLAYRGFYNAVIYNPNTGEDNMRQCNKCKNIFKLS